MPTNDVVAASEKGTIDVFFGGCIIGSDDAKYLCSNCGTEFGGPAPITVPAGTAEFFEVGEHSK